MTTGYSLAQIKLLSGGGEISTRQLHGRQYSFAPTHKLLLMTNYKPHADARDQAFWSRACLIEFGIRFVVHPQAPNERQADPHLKEKLRQERSGILAWLVRGCLAWQQQGLDIPAFISLATEKYRDEEDRILQFLNECCVIRPEASVKAGTLYDAYKTWCKDNQFGSGVNATLFGNEIGRRFEKKRVTAGIIYQGIELGTSSEHHVGSMYTSDLSASGHEKASEASQQVSKAGEYVGYVGLHQVFSPTTFENHSRGQNREQPYIPYINPSMVKAPEPVAEADAGANEIREQPYMNPTSPASPPGETWEEFLL